MSIVCYNSNDKKIKDIDPGEVGRIIGDELTLFSSIKDGAGNPRTNLDVIRDSSINSLDKANILLNIVRKRYNGYIPVVDDEKTGVKNAVFTKLMDKILSTLSFLKKVTKSETDLIDPNVLEDVFRSGYLSPETTISDENTETTRHDETISGTIDEMMYQRFKDLSRYLFSKIPSESISNDFKRNIVKRLFVSLDGDKGHFGKSDICSFNKTIASYLNDLFKIIVDYLNENGYNIPINYLYDLNFKLYGGYRSVIELAFDLIQKHIKTTTFNNSNEHNDLLIAGWGSQILIKSQNGKLSELYNESAHKYYLFTEAWYTLKYFDDLLQQSFGKIISIRGNDNAKNVLPGEIVANSKYYKYSFGIDKTNRNGGFTDENKRNGFTEAGRFSSALLSSLPMFSYRKYSNNLGSPTAIQDAETRDLMDTILLTRAFNKLIHLNIFGKTFDTKDTKVTRESRIKNGLNDFIHNPKMYAKSILDALFSRKTEKTVPKIEELTGLLSSKEIDVLFSLWRNVYSTDEETGASITKLENTLIAKRVMNPRESFVYSDCISSLLHRIVEVEYANINYVDTTISFRNKFSSSNDLFQMVSDVNSSLRQNNLDKYSWKKENEIFTIDLDGLILEINPKGRNDKKDTGANIYNTSSYVYVKTINKKSGKEEFTPIDEYFKDIVFTNASVIQQILNKNSDIHKVLKFISDLTSFHLMNDDMLLVLHIYKTDSDLMFKLLVNGAMQILYATLIQKDFDENNEYDSLPLYLINSKYSSMFKGIGDEIKGEFHPNKNNSLFKKRLDPFGQNTYYLKPVDKSDDWIANLDKALDSYRALTPRSTSTNYSGNKELNGRTAYLGAYVHSYISDIKRSKDVINDRRVSTKNLLLSKPGVDVFRGSMISSDVKSVDGSVVKAVKRMNTAELLFTNIFHNFYGMYGNGEGDLEHLVAFLPTTYSDKSTLVQFLFKTDLGSYGDLMSLSKGDLVNITIDTVGKFYNDSAFNILKDFELIANYIVSSDGPLAVNYKKLFSKFKSVNDRTNIVQKLELLNQILLDFSEQCKQNRINSEFELIKIAKQAGVELQRETHYSIFGGNLGVNPLLYDYVLTFNDSTLTSTFLQAELKKFVNSIIKSGLYINVDDDFVQSAITLKFGGLEKAKQQGWIKNGYLVLAKVGKESIVQGSEITDDKFEVNPLLETFFNAYNAVCPSTRLLLTGSEIAHPLSKSNLYKEEKRKSGSLLNRFAKYGIKKANNLIDLKQQINKIGSSILSNPDVSADEVQYYNELESEYNSLIEELRGIAGAEGVQLKRNVIIPATMLLIQQKALNTISKDIKVAVLSDIQAFVNSFNGDATVEDAHDGAAFINPFFSVLENNGLQDLATNLDKKPIWHHYNKYLGTATLLKYATFTMTNLRMSQSLGSDISLFSLFKKMTNVQWRHTNDRWDSNTWSNETGSKIDLVNGRKFGLEKKVVNGETIEVPKTRILLSDMLPSSQSKLMYGAGNRYWQIVSLNYTRGNNKENDLSIADKGFENVSPIYYTEEYALNALGKKVSNLPTKVYHLFDKDSNHIRLSEEETKARINDIKSGKLHTINSLFELHCALGGVFCVEQVNDEFKSSELNNKVITNYMNFVGDANSVHVSDKTIPGRNIRVENILTQSNYRQPLKELMISVAANTSAMKNGLSNVNPVESWKDNSELSYMIMDSSMYGIQQDSDHDADEAELTEPTQVMTALSQGGYLEKYAKQIYQSIGRVSLIASKVELKAVEDFINKKANGDPKAINELYDIIGRMALHQMASNSSNMDLFEELLSEVKKKFGVKSDDHTLDDLKIAFSDPNIYSKVFPIIISTINSKGIRRKSPGSGMVMAPGYGIYQTFKFGNKRVGYTELIRQSLISKPAEVRPISNLSVQSVMQDVNALLAALQANELSYNYNAFDLGDRVNVIGEGLPPVSIYIDSNDKFYAFDERNWMKLANNKLLSEYVKKHNIINIEGILRANGLTGFINLELLKHPNESIYLNTIALDKILQLYDYGENLTYQEDVTKGVDLLPTRILFTENGIKRSIYHIPFIKNAFKNELEINPFIMRAFLSDLKNGKYYDDYQFETVINDNGESIQLVKRIGEKPHEISDLKYQKPQTIVSNMWATRFNIKGNRTLNQILEGSLFNVDEFFEETKSKITDKAELTFLKGNGNHTLITFDKIRKVDNTREKYFEKIPFNNIRKIRDINFTDIIVYNVVALNSDNSESFVIGKQIERKDLLYKDGKIVDESGKEVNDDGLVPVKIDGFNKIFQTFSYLHKYTYADKYTTYSIDSEKIQEMCKLTGDNYIDFISNLTTELYNEDSYIGFTQDVKDQELLKNSVGILNKLSDDHSELEKYCSAIINNKNADEELYSLLKDYSDELKTSFNKSLEIIGSRIPSQTLLSFMSMEIVDYTLMDTNVAYVSHIQTFLQGSDYDIDKCYMISYFFDDNGKFIKWSPLMSLKTQEELNASCKLPVPSDIKVLPLNSKNKSQLPCNITNELLAILNAGEDKVKEIEAYANLIDKLEDYAEEDKDGSLNVYYIYDPSLKGYSKKINNIIENVNKHESYNISENLKEKALQNANTAKIHLIITDFVNVNSAHTPISMSKARAAANRNSGNAMHSNLWNPAVASEMQFENLVGKNVIGIAANGEKAFFTLYYYFTEGYKKLKRLQENGVVDEKLERLLSFSLKFDRILGRWDADGINKESDIKSITKKYIANLNYEVTGKYNDIDFEVDQMISQLLSAATDNAKELILAKINANTDFAKIYFYGLILGFNLNDLAAFMTSPAVNLLVELSHNNMFDPKSNSISVNSVYRMVSDGYYPSDEFLGRRLSMRINNAIKSSSDNKYNSLQQWFDAKNKGNETQTFEELVESLYAGENNSDDPENLGLAGYEIYESVKSGILKTNIAQFSEYIEGTSKKIKHARNLYVDKYGSSTGFEADLAEFKKLWDNSNEITSLTNVFLSTNQGLPTTFDKYISRVVNILKVVRQREKDLGVDKINGSKEEQLKALKEIVSLNNSSYTNSGELDLILLKAMDLGIFLGFDPNKWLFDKEYRQATIDYYDTIKGTINIFHFLDLHPLYKSNMELFKVSNVMVSETNLKTKLLFKSIRELMGDSTYWDSSKNKKLEDSIGEIIIRKFLENSKLKLALESDWKTFNSQWELENHSRDLKFKSGLDYSNFKYVMELYILPGLQDGSILVKKGKNSISISDNPFIKGLKQIVKYDRPQIALDIDMGLIDISPNVAIKYADYVRGLKELRSCTFPILTMNGSPITVLDLFILYNLIVNKNRYGANNLTTIFKSEINMDDENNLYSKYYKFVGNLDQKAYNNNEEITNAMVKDILIKMAPIIPKSLLPFHNQGYVKVKEYRVISLYKDGKKAASYVVDAEGEQDVPNESLNINIMKYACLFSQTDSVESFINKLNTTDSVELYNIIHDLIATNKLLISYKC